MVDGNKWRTEAIYNFKDFGQANLIQEIGSGNGETSYRQRVYVRAACGYFSF